MITQREKIVARLVHRGYSRKISRSGKYLVFEHPDKKWDLFVGKSGAFRQGTCATKSYALDELTRKKVLVLGEKHLAEEGPDFREKVRVAMLDQ